LKEFYKTEMKEIEGKLPMLCYQFKFSWPSVLTLLTEPTSSPILQYSLPGICRVLQGNHVTTLHFQPPHLLFVLDVDFSATDAKTLVMFLRSQSQANDTCAD
jgi:hypothetical protein